MTTLRGAPRLPWWLMRTGYSLMFVMFAPIFALMLLGIGEGVAEGLFVRYYQTTHPWRLTLGLPLYLDVSLFVLVLELMTVIGDYILIRRNPRWFVDSVTEGNLIPLAVVYIGLAGTMLTVAAMFTVAFAECCKFWYLTYGGFTARMPAAQLSKVLVPGVGHPSAAQWLSADWTWARFGLALCFDALTFNLSQVFGWRLTDIAPTTTWLRLLTWAFVVVFQVGAIANVLQAIKALRERRTARNASAAAPAHGRGTDIS